MRLTADLVGAAPVRINPAEERELDLRGLRAPAIESLGATLVRAAVAARRASLTVNRCGPAWGDWG